MLRFPFTVPIIHFDNAFTCSKLTFTIPHKLVYKTA